jgi:hypothetical protein
LRVTLSNYTSGDAKWFFAPVTINGSSTYTYSHWYQSDVDTSLVLEYTLIGGQKTYTWLGSLSPTTDWTRKTVALTPPTDVARVTIHHVLKQNGTLTTDDYSLTQN